MEEFLKLVKHPTLVIFLLAGIGITNIANLKLSTNPDVVRPDPYTGKMAAEIAKTVDRRLAECDAAIQNERDWRDAHIEFGRASQIQQSAINERHKAQIEELYRRLP